MIQYWGSFYTLDFGNISNQRIFVVRCNSEDLHPGSADAEVDVEQGLAAEVLCEGQPYWYC